MRVADFVTGAQRELVDELIQRQVRERQDVTAEFEVVTRQGERRVLEVSTSPHPARRHAGGDPGHRARRHRAQGTGTGAAQPDDHRRPDEAVQPPGLPHARRAAPQAGRAEEERRLPAVCRPRWPEDHQRHLRAPRRRPRAHRRGRHPAHQLPQRRHHRAPGRRRVHRVSHRGGGRERLDPDRAGSTSSCSATTTRTSRAATGWRSASASPASSPTAPGASTSCSSTPTRRSISRSDRRGADAASLTASRIASVFPRLEASFPFSGSPRPVPRPTINRCRPRAPPAASVRLPTPAQSSSSPASGWSPSSRWWCRCSAIRGCRRMCRTATCGWPAAWSRPTGPKPTPAALSATLSQAPPGAVRVPALDAQGYVLDGGTHVTLGGTPAALAIYHNALRDLVTWHGVAGTARRSSADAGPAGPGRPALRHALQGLDDHCVLAGRPDPDGRHVRVAGRARDGHRAGRIGRRATLIQSARRSSWTATQHRCRCDSFVGACLARPASTAR